MTDIGFFVGVGVKTSHSKLFEHLKRIFNFKNLFTTHNSQFTKAIAFTLAETLIVMGIIGVVAALTLPNLNSSTGDREKVAKVKKIYQNLNDAQGRLEAIYGPIQTWNCSTYSSFSACYYERLSDVLKISKSCKNKNACKSSGIIGHTGEPDLGYLLSDGMQINSLHESTEKKNCTDYCFHIYVNINGSNKTKVLNKDVFDFYVTDEGIIPNGDSASGCYIWKRCTRWVIENGNMDYLKADSSGKCPNGVQLSETQTTCK